MLERKRPLLGTLALIAVVALVSWSGPAAAESARQGGGLEVVARGLNNPRGLAFTASGDGLLVAEAGAGGSEPCVEGPEGRVCLGTTGSLAKVDLGTGAVVRVVTGLPSVAGSDPPGSSATGLHDVAAIDDDEFYLVIGLGGTPAVRAALGPAAATFGHVVRVRQGEAPQPVADLAAFEVANDVDGAGPDSNPYALALRSDRLFVVDAGANTLDAVGANGAVQVATMFPSRFAPAPPFINPPPPGGQIPMQAVPNSAAVGPDGAIYVGELTGFPFPAGGARVYRVGANGEAEVYAEGFTNIIAIDFDKQGNLYVLELAKDGLLAAGPDAPPVGRLVRVARDSKAQTVLASEGLIAPGGLAVGDNAIYISNFSILAGAGEIVRIKR